VTYNKGKKNTDLASLNKRAQRALGRSPEEKAKGPSGANKLIENPRGII